MANSKVQILLVEDEIAHAALIRRAFELRESQVELRVTHSLREARRAMAQTKPDLAIVDLLLPDGKGIEFLREGGEERPYPVIIMTSHGDEQVAVEAIRAGALDYVVKSDLSLLELPHTAERALREWSHITEHQQAEASLRASEERFRQVISSISDHIYMTEILRDGRFQHRYLSPNCLELTGYTAKHLLQDWQKWINLIHPEDHQHVLAQWQRLSQGHNSEIEYRLQHINGTYIWVRDNARIKHEGNARIVYGVISNITERKQIEDELRQYRDHLEDLVVQRTAELKRATEAAQTANRAKSEFLSNMSHELRTPLNGILGYAQILKRDTNLTNRQKDALNIISESGNHLLTLINDILDLSKIEASRMDLYPTEIHLPKFLNDIADIIHMRAQQKQIDFHYLPAPTLPIGIQADEKRLRQILINLLDNAVKFTDQGQVTFRITLKQKSASPNPTATLRFAIIDTGVGMEQDQIAKIFHPFEQVGDRQRRAEGTGLGLAISRHLVQLMGSNLVVESQPNQGSTFWFDVSFPISDTTLPALSPPTSNIIGYTGHRRRALVIDDKKHNLLVLSDMLESIGFETVLAESGEEGLEKAQEIQPDVIFVDLIMPGMSGYDTVQIMRQIPQLQTTSIIAVSASTFEEDRQDSLFAGCNAFLAKPLDEKTLLGVLSDHLNLEWLQENKPAATKAAFHPFTEKPESNPAVRKFDLPPTQEMNILLDLAMRGDMRGIRKHASYLGQLNEKYKPFTTTLQTLARAYEERKILQLIQTHIENSTPAS